MRAEAVQGRVAGVLNELEINATLQKKIQEGLLAILQGKATVPPPERVFTASIGLYVAEQLADISKLEDCLLQGRLNCERIQLSRG